jgi:hypothetical protein
MPFTAQKIFFPMQTHALRSLSRRTGLQPRYNPASRERLSKASSRLILDNRILERPGKAEVCLESNSGGVSIPLPIAIFRKVKTRNEVNLTSGNYGEQRAETGCAKR